MKSLIGVGLAVYSSALFFLVVFLSHSHISRTYTFTLPDFPENNYGPPPAFGQYKTVEEKKSAFFSYFSIIINDENNKIIAQRKILLNIKNQLKNGDNSEALLAFSDNLSDTYQVAIRKDKLQQIDDLLERMDVVPRSLVLAQAANESAWGTSRFATEGNNYFGQWCFKPGCGMVPQYRKEDAYHEVRVFSSAAASVKSYMLNINTHPAYRTLRIIRLNAHKHQRYPSGELLAQGLASYSERGEKYVEEIREIIRTNHLDGGEQLPELGTRLLKKNFFRSHYSYAKPTPSLAKRTTFNCEGMSFSGAKFILALTAKASPTEILSARFLQVTKIPVADISRTSASISPIISCSSLTAHLNNFLPCLL